LPPTFVSKPTIENSEAWSSRGLAPDTSALGYLERRVLASQWLEDALMEHTSIAAFARLARELQAAAFPAHLVAWAHRAALEEIGHARDAFALASAYAGRALSAGAFPVATSHAPVSLARLATEALVDGCLGEGTAAACASVAQTRATDPAVRRALERVAREEASHAELSWAILAHCRRIARAEVETAVREALASLSPAAPARRALGTSSMLAAHGYIDAHGRAALFAQVREEVIARSGADAAAYRDAA
jgi:hypothetical protein